MALIRRWRYVTDDARTLTKRVISSVLVMSGALVVLKAVLP